MLYCLPNIIVIPLVANSEPSLNSYTFYCFPEYGLLESINKSLEYVRGMGSMFRHASVRMYIISIPFNYPIVSVFDLGQGEITLKIIRFDKVSICFFYGQRIRVVNSVVQ